VPTAFVEEGIERLATASVATSDGVSVFKAAAPQTLLPGQIGGKVVDQSGAAVPNAHVTITSPETGLKRDAYTDAHGDWVAYGFGSGQLQFKVDSQGFQTSNQNFLYSANQPHSTNTELRVGATNETVTVSAEAVSVDRDREREQREAKRQGQIAQSMPSENVLNLQKRVAGVLPIAVDVPHAGTAFHFLRPLVVNEETKVTFAYKSRG